MVDQFLTIPKDELAEEREAIPAGSLRVGDTIHLTATGTMIWVEPAPRVLMGRSIWDTTDEMYITYNEEGERVLTTTGEDDIWNQTHSYQRAGSSQYDTLSERLELAGAVPAGGVKRSRGIGERARAAIVRLLRGTPPWRRGASVQPDSDRDDTRSGPGRRARAHSEDHRARVDGATRDARDWSDWGGVQERPNPIRSHRHCPGCSGHDRVFRGTWGLLARAVGAWALGWFAIWSTGLGLEFPQYVILTGMGFFVATLLRPAWREWVYAEDRRSY